MNEKDLLPALDAVYQRDQATLRKLNSRIAELEGERSKLHEPLQHSAKHSNHFEHAKATNSYLNWQEIRLREISHMVFELQPELNDAKQQLKKSFGRIEALKAIVNET